MNTSKSSKPVHVWYHVEGMPIRGVLYRSVEEACFNAAKYIYACYDITPQELFAELVTADFSVPIMAPPDDTMSFGVVIQECESDCTGTPDLN